MAVNQYPFFTMELHPPTPVVTEGAEGGTINHQGSGSPEGAETAEPTSLYRNTDTDAIWWKASGSGNVGWVQITGPF